MEPKKDQMSYDDAFDMAEQPAQPVNEDAEFGLIPDPEDVDGGEATPAVAVVVDAAPADAGTEGKAAGAMAEAAETDVPEGAEPAQEQMNLEGGESKQAEVDEAIKMLTDDFGDEFVKAVQLVASAAAGNSAKPVEGEPTTSDLIDEIKNLSAKIHFERIFDAHPDFLDIAASPEFESWVNGKPEEEKTAIQSVIDSGSARDVVAMLGKYKAETAKPAEPAPNADEFADAEGVASSGMRMPESKPAGAKTYEESWDEA